MWIWGGYLLKILRVFPLRLQLLFQMPVLIQKVLGLFYILPEIIRHTQHEPLIHTAIGMFKTCMTTEGTLSVLYISRNHTPYSTYKTDRYSNRYDNKRYSVCSTYFLKSYTIFNIYKTDRYCNRYDNKRYSVWSTYFLKSYTIFNI